MHWGFKGQELEGLRNNFWSSLSNVGDKSSCLEEKPNVDYRSVGPFESRPYWCDDSDGPTSLPSFGQNSKIYSFEVGSSSSSSGNSVLSLTRSNSALSFSSKSKKFDWGNSSSSRSSYSWSRKISARSTNSPQGGSSSCLNTPRGGSSTSITSLGSSCEEKRCLDWSRVVDNVFKKEIGKLAEHFHGDQDRK